MADGTEHERWMRIALQEGYKALPACLPNPPVGCVIVHKRELLARGHTSPPGHPHAEAMALQRLRIASTGVLVYVTLEPCSFHGRTPSCAEALAAAGVGRVYVGMIDSDPRNQGRGLEILRAAGIVVEVGVLRAEVEAALAPYLIRP
jgi:pyrimidine deaminase RibD-like protein